MYDRRQYGQKKADALINIIRDEKVGSVISAYIASYRDPFGSTKVSTGKVSCNAYRMSKTNLR